VPCRSFRVSGAEIDVTRMFLGLVAWSSADGCDVVNLSKGGLCFESSRAFAIGEQLELMLWIPDRREPIALKGNVRWCKTTAYGGTTVGVQFATFGTKRGHNAVEALEVLRELEANHV
jgi:Tfp pilus assembly protein PilZ